MSTPPFNHKVIWEVPTYKYMEINEKDELCTIMNTLVFNVEEDLEYRYYIPIYMYIKKDDAWSVPSTDIITYHQDTSVSIVKLS